jgi:long-chain acyl-CoA synthetase
LKSGRQNFEYRNDPEKTNQARRGEFFTVWDLGYVDEGGWLYLCDRKSDVIISGGVNIYPAEIECVLLTHPAVADAAVFGTPDVEWGERVTALIQLAPGKTASAELTAELAAFCRERLAAFKCPRAIDYTEQLPREPNGKLYKRRLRERV